MNRVARHVLTHGAVQRLQEHELEKRFKASRVSHVLANYGPTAVSLMRVCESNKLPLIAHFHGYDAHTESVVAKHSEAYRMLGKKAKAIIVVSDFMRHALMAVGVAESTLHLLRCSPEAGSHAIMRPVPESPTFVAVGRMVEKKAPYLTLLAFAKITSRLPAARLILVGDGPLREVVESMVLALDLEHKVECAGALTHEAVADVLGRATAFVQHSVSPRFGGARGDCEGTPVAIQEAMAAGVPIVSTRHAGIPEILRDGESALLVDERDVNAMADAMLRIALDPLLAGRLGREARKRVDEGLNAREYARKLRAIIVS